MTVDTVGDLIDALQYRSTFEEEGVDGLLNRAANKLWELESERQRLNGTIGQYHSVGSLPR
jgi:hypothetical protein